MLNIHTYKLYFTCSFQNKASTSGDRFDTRWRWVSCFSSTTFNWRNLSKIFDSFFQLFRVRVEVSLKACLIRVSCDYWLSLICYIIYRNFLNINFSFLTLSKVWLSSFWRGRIALELPLDFLKRGSPLKQEFQVQLIFWPNYSDFRRVSLWR